MAERRAQGANALTAIHSAVRVCDDLTPEVTIVRSFRAILPTHRLEFYQRTQRINARLV